MRSAILDVARNLVASEGANNLSMRAIARDLGYSPAALYEYFPGKEDVFCALYLEGAGGLAGRMRTALDALPDDAPANERLLAIGLAYRRFALEQPELYRLAFGSGTADYEPGDAERAAGGEAFQILVDTARAGVGDGTFAQIPPEALALACWSMVHGFVMIELAGMVDKKLGPGSATADQLFHATLTVLGQGFMRR
jgi:AcrR family transcriptional regulator